MKIADAVYTAAVFLQLDSVCDCMSADGFDSNDYTGKIDADAETEINLLLRCCNLVLGELGESGFALKERTEIATDDGDIFYTSFDKKVTDIYKVERGGVSIPFCMYYDRITLPESGEFTVTYSFTPSAASLGDSSPYKGNKPSARLIAYGIAREYCLISGMSDDAVMWNSRFESCVQAESAVRASKSVRRRIWR